MKKNHGAEFTKRVKKRYDQILAMPCFSEYLALGLGNPHALVGDLERFYGVSVTGNLRMLIEPVCEDLSVESLKGCEEVIMRGVVDYHGQKIEWIIP